MPLKFQIPFTRFHPPFGRREPVMMEADAETFAFWERLHVAGPDLRLTVEALPMNMISLCIEHPKLGDFDCVVVPNGPKVTAAARKMLERFTPAKLGSWIMERS